jgi:hypothetical protein
MESADGGTMVTESMHQTVASPVVIRVLRRRAGVRDGGADLHDGMVTTLDRRALAVEEFPAPVH